MTRWPDRWQPEAMTCVEGYVDDDARLRITVGDPATSIDGTVLEGYVRRSGDALTLHYDESGAADVHPWPLPVGPVLQVAVLRARRPPDVVFANPDWEPRRPR